MYPSPISNRAVMRLVGALECSLRLQMLARQKINWSSTGQVLFFGWIALDAGCILHTRSGTITCLLCGTGDTHSITAHQTLVRLSQQTSNDEQLSASGRCYTNAVKFVV